MICKHEWLVESYSGHACAVCGVLIYPDGCEPWMPNDGDYGLVDYEDDSDYPTAGRDEADDEEDYWLYTCGWVRGQGCTLAGTEECDFECPMRANFEKGMRLSEARLAKRGKPHA